MREKENIEFAKTILYQMFSDPLAKDGLPVKTIYAIGKDKGLVKGILKKARKEIGLSSENRNGVQYWFLPPKE